MTYKTPSGFQKCCKVILGIPMTNSYLSDMINNSYIEFAFFPHYYLQIQKTYLVLRLVIAKQVSRLYKVFDQLFRFAILKI